MNVLITNFSFAKIFCKELINFLKKKQVVREWFDEKMTFVGIFFSRKKNGREN